MALDLLEPLEALAGLVVKNTFIEMIPPSVDAFYRKRASRSCPPKRTGSLLSDVLQGACVLASEAQLPSQCRNLLSGLQGACELADEVQLPSPCRILTPTSSTSSHTPPVQASPRPPMKMEEETSIEPLECAAGDAGGDAVIETASFTTHSAEIDHDGAVTPTAYAGLADGSAIAGKTLPPALLQCVATQPVCIAVPAAAVAVPPPPPNDPAPGSFELPSIGSLGHPTGDCRPCAFLHTKGCSTGPACKFCHLCGPGERKRRLREKRERIQQDKAKRRAARAQALEAAEVAPAYERFVSL